MTKPAKPAAVPQFVIDYFAGQSVLDLEAREYEGRGLHPFTLKRKNPTGRGVVEFPVMLRSPSAMERGDAAIKACRIVADRALGKGAKDRQITVEEACSYVGRANFETYEIVALLALSVRDPAPPYAQLSTAEELLSTFTLATLRDALDRIDLVVEAEDPRIPEELDEASFWALVAGIAKAGDIGPLAVTVGRARSSFVLSMAVQLQSYRLSSSSPPSSENSTPAP